ncbi:MAG TPA: hypothetical protein VLD58_05455 [Gemmatimonadales bacterium]|nr:hypothetical protein [Gemmatimonadales bacterium]
MTRRRVLFLCTHNAARSQKAEAVPRAWTGNRFEVASAGTEASRVHSLAIQVMHRPPDRVASLIHVPRCAQPLLIRFPVRTSNRGPG